MKTRTEDGHSIETGKTYYIVVAYHHRICDNTWPIPRFSVARCTSVTYRNITLKDVKSRETFKRYDMYYNRSDFIYRNKLMAIRKFIKMCLLRRKILRQEIGNITREIELSERARLKMSSLLK
jgi:hypothetical protein